MKLAIDPGLTTGWAIFSDKNELLDFGAYNPPNGPFKASVCECPKVYPRSPVPPNDLITLAVQVGRYAEKYCCSLIFPQQWKGQLPKDICHLRITNYLDQEQQKKIQTFPKSIRHNVYDAIGIGLYFFAGVNL